MPQPDRQASTAAHHRLWGSITAAQQRADLLKALDATPPWHRREREWLLHMISSLDKRERLNSIDVQVGGDNPGHF